MKYRYLTPLFLTVLILLPLTLTSSSGVSEDFPEPISNIIEGECHVAAPVIEVIQPCEGCGDGRILPETVGINKPYMSKIKVSLAAGEINDVNIIILFTSNDIEFTEGDVSIEATLDFSDGHQEWSPFTCDVKEGNKLLCNYYIETFKEGYCNCTIKITITSEEWLDKDFNYELYVGHL